MTESKEPLTKKQAEILDYINAFVGSHGMAPTMYEIADHFELTAPTVFVHLQKLAKKGYIEKKNKARSMKVVGSGGKPKFVSQTLSIPILGRISAGVPLLSEENYDGVLSLMPSHVKGYDDSKPIFALTINGDSMEEAGILHGDHVVCIQDPNKKIVNGDIVVASIYNSETTVKTIEFKGDKVHLIPHNSKYDIQIYPKSDVLIQGIVIGLQRFY
ncbi:MAG: transcriptional repressor LexA [Lentisphaeria bacterium]|nr:transcriptional repressor LexA [Lentisphaeria bacterium]